MAECDACVFNKATPAGYVCAKGLDRLKPTCRARKSMYSNAKRKGGNQ